SSTIIVGTSGEGAAIGKVRGHSLYISTDCGKTFTQLEEPQSTLARADESGFVGYVAARTAFDGEYLYITMSETGTHGWSFSSYSCDCGAQKSGKVMRYRLLADGTVTECKDITPPVNIDNRNLQEDYAPFGMGGIAVYQGCEVLSKPLLLCSTICNKDNGDIVFVSRDKGETWSRNLQGLTVGKINFTVPYMKPEYNGNDSLLHWLTDIKINPYNPQHAVFNSGTGCFMTYNLLEDDCTWEPWTFGIEETVHLNIYSPPTGDVKVIDILGDLGGFAFSDVDQPAENTFADEKGNRYITCMNADYPDTNPEFVVVTPRGNWTGRTKGGLMVSKDQCKSFELLPHPYGLSSFIDGLLDDIKRPNVNSGWAAVSADSKTIVWSIARILSLPVNAVVYTKDGGKTFEKCKIYDKSGECISETYECPPIIDYKTYDEFFEYCSSLCNIKVMADRVNPDIFYGFGDYSKFYVSTDGGATFYQKDTPAGFPTMSLAGIDCISYAEIRVESGKEGVIWMATNESGLWKVSYNRTTEEFSARRVTKEGDTVKCQGMGLGLNGGKALYISGTIGGVYGFWKSEDEGETFTRINNEGQMYGDIMSITGDPRVAGRIYVATGSRGLFYGEPVR
ncbi:MAG TPA: endoglucanase, partial [Lachnospiraceae bacterium]|nr:endoglucanase [Lachnospiraceae bacterium]